MRKKTIAIAIAICAIGAASGYYLLRGSKIDPEKAMERADTFFASKKFDGARIEYLRVLSVQPENARAFKRIGHIYLEQGIPLRGIPFLARALELAPEDVESKRRLAKALMSIGDVVRARMKAAECLDEQPVDGELVVLIANSSVREEDIKNSEERLKHLDPESDATYHVARAILASRKGVDDAEVRPMLDRAFEMSPDAESVLVARANYFGSIGESKLEGESLAAVSEMAPLRSGNRLRYARYLVRNGEKERAKDLIEAVAEEIPDYVPAWIMLAEMALGEGEHDAALELLERVLGRDPVNFGAQMTKAEIFLAQGKADEATELLTKLDEVYRAGYPGLKYTIKMSLARLYLRSGDGRRARVVIDEALAISPSSPEAVIMGAELDIRSGRASAAAESLEKFLQARPGLRQAENLLARAYQLQGKEDDAAAIFREQLKATPGEVGPLFLLGISQRRKGELDSAYESLEKALQVAPEDMGIVFQLVDLDLERENFDAALAMAQEFTAKVPGDWAPLFLQGRVFAVQEQWDEAEEALNKALELKPDSMSVYSLLVNIYLRQEQLPQAIERLRTFLEASPERAQQRLLLAMLLEQRGDAEGAVAEYETILEDQPDQALVLNNLAYLYAEKLDDLERGLEMATRARALAAGDAAVADTLGWIRFRREEYDQAIPLLEEAAEKLPENAEIQYHVGMARYMLGDKESSRKAFELALASGQQFSGIEEARKRLAALRSGTGGVGAETVELLKARLERTPDDLVARIRLGQVYEKAGAVAEAAAAYSSALQGNSDLVPALSGLARLNLGPLDDVEKAAAYAQRARAEAPRDPEVLHLSGDISLRQGDFEYAYGLLKTAMRSDSDAGAGLRVAVARAAYGIGKLDEARSTMTWIVENAGDSPESAEAKRFLGLTGNPGTAAAKLAEEAPQSLPALMYAAAAAGGAKATGAYEQILNRSPNFAPAQRTLAHLLARSGEKLEQAEILAAKAREAYGEDANLLYTLALISHWKGDHDYAASLFEKSGAKEPLDAEGLAYHGLSLIGIGNGDEGGAKLRSALEGGLPKALKERAEAALDKLSKPGSEEVIGADE